MAIVIKMPALSPTMEKGKIIKWHKQLGENIQTGEVLVEIETDKTVMEVEATDNGIVGFIMPEDKEYVIGTIIAILKEQDHEDISQYLEITSTISASIMPNNTSDRIKISPLAKKLAFEHSIQYTNIKGSGPGQRIIKDDIQRLIFDKRNLVQAYDSITNAPHATTNKECHMINDNVHIKASPNRIPCASKDKNNTTNPIINTNNNEKIDMTTLKIISAKRLTESKTKIPHFYISKKINTSQLVSLKTEMRQYSISLNDIFLKIIGKAAEANIVNSHYINDQIIQFKEVNIGFAVNTKQGLLVPVVDNINSKTLTEVSCMTKTLIKHCNEKFSMPQGKPGTITISNMGMMNIDNFSAIINPPEVAIIAISSITTEPYILNNNISIGSFINITGSFDHRVVDGVAGAEFMNLIQKYIENPLLCLI